MAYAQSRWMTPDFLIESFSMDPMYALKMENMKKILEFLAMTGQNHPWTIAKHAKAPMILTDLYLTHHHEVNSEAPPDLESSRHSEIAGEICIVHRNHMKPLLNSLPKAPRPQGPKAEPCGKRLLCRFLFQDFPQVRSSTIAVPLCKLSLVVWSTDFQNFWLRACLFFYETV